MDMFNLLWTGCLLKFQVISWPDAIAHLLIESAANEVTAKTTTSLVRISSVRSAESALMDIANDTKNSRVSRVHNIWKLSIKTAGDIFHRQKVCPLDVHRENPRLPNSVLNLCHLVVEVRMSLDQWMGSELSERSGCGGDLALSALLSTQRPTIRIRQMQLPDIARKGFITSISTNCINRNTKSSNEIVIEDAWAIDTITHHAIHLQAEQTQLTSNPHKQPGLDPTF